MDNNSSLLKPCFSLLKFFTYMIDSVVNNLSGGPSSLRLPDIVQGCATIIQRTHFVLVGFRISVFDKIRPKQEISLFFGYMILILNIIEKKTNKITKDKFFINNL